MSYFHHDNIVIGQSSYTLALIGSQCEIKFRSFWRDNKL